MKIASLNKYLVALLACSGPLFVQAQTDAAASRGSVEDEVLISVTATVQDLDLEKRELTLKGSLGDVTTVTVDKAVKRLNEVKVGDEVTAKYYLSIAADLREPTEDEKSNPLVVTAGVAKAPKGTAPAAGGLRMVRAVTTVEGLERPTRLLTLKGPRGNYVTVRARDPKRLETLRLGDTIVVTFTEALAVSVEKAKKKAKED